MCSRSCQKPRERLNIYRPLTYGRFHIHFLLGRVHVLLIQKCYLVYMKRHELY